MMTDIVLFQEMGKLVGNLQSFEFLLRSCLYSSVGPQDATLNFDQLAVGDLVPENPLTNYDSLGDLIKKVNAQLEAAGRAERVDDSLVIVRDALAHGRVTALRPHGPFRLVKFLKPMKHKVIVAIAIDLSPQWLAEQINKTRQEAKKVYEVGHGLGLSAFPDMFE